MALNDDVKNRIFAAADKLHEESVDGAFPNVDAVRQLSRANMNSVVEGMKEWRQKQRKQVQAVKEPLPTDLHVVVQAMGQSLWETAQQMANESLSTARTAFEAEKADLIQLSREQSESFESQALELSAAVARIEEQGRAIQEAGAANQALGLQVEALRGELARAEQGRAVALQRAEDGERLAADLRTELGRAHATAETATNRAERAEFGAAEAREALVALTEKSERTIDGLRSELSAVRTAAEVATKEAANSAARLTKTESESEAARKAAAAAREEAAALRGQLEATKTHIEALRGRVEVPEGDGAAPPAPGKDGTPAKTGARRR